MNRVLHAGWLFALVIVGLLVLPSSARAQERGFASGLGAVTFGTVAGSTFAGRAGVTVSPNLMVFGEFGRMTDVLPTSDQTTINNNAALVTSADGTVATVGGHMPANYGIGGVRVSGNMMGRVTPYAEGSFGFAHMMNELTATLGATDVSSQVLTTPLTMTTSQTNPLMMLGGGVSIAAGKRSAVDVGYTYSRIFAPDQGIYTGHIYGALRVGF
jgi:opacity protein-like surface antigen